MSQFLRLERATRPVCGALRFELTSVLNGKQEYFLSLTYTCHGKVLVGIVVVILVVLFEIVAAVEVEMVVHCVQTSV